MKNILVLFLLFTNTVKSQQKDNHIFLDPDKTPNCAMLKTGKFYSVKYASTDYYLEAKGDQVTEYVSNGKYYVKTKRIFINNCLYKSTITEITIPNYNLNIGDTIITEILETECEFVKVKIIMGKVELITVLEKVK